VGRQRQCDVCKQETDPGFASDFRMRGVTLALATEITSELVISVRVCDHCFGMVAKIKEAITTIVASYGPDAETLPTARAVSLKPRGAIGWLRSLCGW